MDQSRLLLATIGGMDLTQVYFVRSGVSLMARKTGGHFQDEYNTALSMLADQPMSAVAAYLEGQGFTVAGA